MKRVLGVLVGLVFLGAAHSAFAACALTSLTFKDASGATQTLCFGGSAGQFIPGYNLLDSTGANVASVSAGGALKVDGSAVTQPVSAASLPLPTGAATSAKQPALGTAGSASTDVISIQGIASMTKLLVTADPLAAGSNTIGKVDVLGNAGAIMDFAGQNATQPANSLLVGCAFNTSPSTVSSGNATQIQCDNGGQLLVHGLAQASTTSGQTGSLVQGAVTTAAPSYTTAQTDPISLDPNGNLRVLQDAGCAGASQLNTTYTPFSLASTTSLKLVSKVAAKKVYICSINIVSASANNVALIEGTHTTTDCDTSTAGLAGGTTAATGWNFAANGGLTLGNGVGIVVKSGTANFDVCLLASGSSQVSGGITWAQF